MGQFRFHGTWVEVSVSLNKKLRFGDAAPFCAHDQIAPSATTSESRGYVFGITAPGYCDRTMVENSGNTSTVSFQHWCGLKPALLNGRFFARALWAAIVRKRSHRPCLFTALIFARAREDYYHRSKFMLEIGGARPILDPPSSDSCALPAPTGERILRSEAAQNPGFRDSLYFYPESSCRLFWAK